LQVSNAFFRSQKMQKMMSECVRGARRRGPAARGDPGRALGAAGILLQETGLGPGPVLRLRQGTPGLFAGDPSLPLHVGGEEVHALHRSQATKVAEPWTARQCRHLSYVAEFTGDIRHIAGQDNVVADTLSRPPQAGTTVAAVAATGQTLDYAAIAEAQRDCPSIQAAGDSNLTLQLVPFGTVRVLCDTQSRHPRPAIPLGHRRQVFDRLPRHGTPRGKGHEKDHEPESDMVLHEQRLDTVG